MLALIGMVVLIAVGVMFLLIAFINYAGMQLLTGKVEWLPVIAFGTLGGACLWAAVHWAPFSVNWVG